jgi:hypothetical protein
MPRVRFRRISTIAPAGLGIIGSQPAFAPRFRVWLRKTHGYDTHGYDSQPPPVVLVMMIVVATCKDRVLFLPAGEDITHQVEDFLPTQSIEQPLRHG